jgi:hypothetical protein
VRIAHRVQANGMVGNAHPSMIILESSVSLQINPFLPAVRTFIAVASFHKNRLTRMRQDQRYGFG